MLPNGTEITYEYVPETWRKEAFLACGGFTVVFLNYNKAPFIRRSVESVLALEFPLLEMFFMDDASTDGSGDVMEQLAQNYRGSHKVTVVRNRKNQRITGQWNIVSKLANGIWLGMFCADDTTEPDRVTYAAEITRRYPTLKGFCTSGRTIDSRGDELVSGTLCEGGEILEPGTLSPWMLANHSTPIIGATAFWHISNFERPLPAGPLDDVILRWIVYFRNVDNPAPVWLADMTRQTICYNVGAGITNEYAPTHDVTRSARERWRLNSLALRHYAMVDAKTMRALLDYAETIHASAQSRASIRRNLLRDGIVASGTFGRIALIPAVLRDCLSRNPGRGALLRLFLKRFAAELFGLRVGSVLAAFREWCCGSKA